MKDVNECELGTVCQGQNELCKNTEASFECHCTEGFTREFEKCVEISGCIRNRTFSPKCEDLEFNCFCDKLGNSNLGCSNGYTEHSEWYTKNNKGQSFN